MQNSSCVLLTIAINSFITPCALAYSLHEDNKWTLNAGAELSMGVFHSNKSYALNQVPETRKVLRGKRRCGSLEWMAR